MSIYRREFNVRESFPVEIDEEWHVMQSGRVAEHWRVIKKTPCSFVAEITEFFPE